MKIIALGASNFLAECVRGLADAGCKIQAIITLPKHLLPDNSIDLTDVATETDVEIIEVADINSEVSKKYLTDLNPELIFSAWPKLIKEDILCIPQHGVIGTHPTALPFNKGRHPLQWEIVLGMQESRLSFFKMDAGIDTGPIILQVPYTIFPDDTIATLNDRLNLIARTASANLGKIFLANGVPNGIHQDEQLSNTWRKRDRYDVLIDFRMTVKDIIALVRSFAEPYPCASFIYENNLIKVLSAERFRHESPIPTQYYEPGHILKFDGKFLYIKAADGFIKLLLKLTANQSFVMEKKYIHPPCSYMAKYDELKKFF